jgi:hypothetical protein
LAEERLIAFNDMVFTIEKAKANSREIATYDCIVALSGGKDSSYVLKYLVEEHGVRALAITVDNGFLSRQSIENSRALCDHLHVDFILFRPDFQQMRRIYMDGLESKNDDKAMIKRASDLCSNCINLINAVMLKEALGRNVSLIVGGYISGQVPKGGSIMKLNLKTLADFTSFRRKGLNKNRKDYGPSPADFSRFTNGTSISICNPFLAMDYDEHHILTELGRLGWRRPNDTGAHSSNCRINDLGILNHQQKYGFHPYELEISEQVRRGSLTYEQAKAKIDADVDRQRVEQVERELQKAE